MFGTIAPVNEPGRAERGSSTDPRAERVRASLLKAGMELMRRRQISDISVAELVGVAGVSRPAFYKHFADRDDLLVTALKREMDAVVAGVDDPTESAWLLLRWLDRNRALHAHIHPSYAAQRASEYLRELLRPWCSGLVKSAGRTWSPTERARVEAFLLGGLLELMRQAFSQRPPRRIDPDDLMRLTARLARAR